MRVHDRWQLPVVVSTHPRTRKRLEALEGFEEREATCAVMEPFGFHDYNKLQLECRLRALGLRHDLGGVLDPRLPRGHAARLHRAAGGSRRRRHHHDRPGRNATSSRRWPSPWRTGRPRCRPATRWTTPRGASSASSRPPACAALRGTGCVDSGTIIRERCVQANRPQPRCPPARGRSHPRLRLPAGAGGDEAAGLLRRDRSSRDGRPRGELGHHRLHPYARCRQPTVATAPGPGQRRGGRVDGPTSSSAR